MRRKEGDREVARTEYYVVDGHHRVAMAKKLGQDYLDAHVVEYRVAEPKDAPLDSQPPSSPPAHAARTPPAT
ncbi:MAG TPA: ParB/RepB/Spo0J family partition protein [Chloroflexota bacterium]|nr:ParB/RepB/Spo0J family partition protein [Chloroflexota bacterium]